MPKRVHPGEEASSTKQGRNKTTKFCENVGDETLSSEPAEKRRKKQKQQKKGTATKTLKNKSKNIGEEEEEILVDVERVEDEEEERERDKFELAEIPGKSRREKEKNAFIKLAELLPLFPAIRDQLDKSGILRISIAFLQLQQLISGLMGRNDGIGDEAKTKSEHKEARRIQREWAIGREGTFEPLKQFAFNLFQAMDGFLIVLNQKGQVVYVNETVAVHLGLSQIELIGNSLADFLHPADVQLLREKLAIFVDSRELRVIVPELRFVLRFRCTPGRRPMMSTSSSRPRDAPGFKPIHFMGTLWPDAPGRFIAFGQPLVAYGHNELRLSPSMFMFRSTPSLELIFICKRFTSISGFQPNALLDHSFYSFVHPADNEFLIEMHQNALDQGQAQSALFRMIGARGGYFWVQCRICLINSNRHAYISPRQILAGICAMISEMEYENEILDSIQKEILMASKEEVSKKNKGDEDEEEGDEEADGGDGLLGYYSRKFYQENNESNANDELVEGNVRKLSKAKNASSRRTI